MLVFEYNVITGQSYYRIGFKNLNNRECIINPPLIYSGNDNIINKKHSKPKKLMKKNKNLDKE